jgi:dephospho-CoA kinase
MDNSGQDHKGERSRQIVIGLIGGIGSGKSTVAEELKNNGGQIISGDALGHEALRQPDIRQRVVSRWGPEILTGDGEIDRRRLGRIVFSDAEERKALESIVFPYIKSRLRAEIARCFEDPRGEFVVLDAAVLLEAGWNEMCTHVVFIHAPRNVRLSRLREQRGWCDQELAARERAQMPLAVKKRRADFVVDNGGDHEEMARQVQNLVRSLQSAVMKPAQSKRTH